MMAGLAIALIAYALDCGAMTSPEQAMECCKAMPCSSPRKQNPDCCKRMAAAHSPFVQAPSLNGASLSLSAVAALPAPGGAIQGLAPAFCAFPAHCHAPPGIHLVSSPPLRI